VNSIRTPLNKRPVGTLVLRKSFEQWSAGTRVDFIEYVDTIKGFPTKVLGRIHGEQLTIPIDMIVERR
jgi:hypothetical protein